MTYQKVKLNFYSAIKTVELTQFPFVAVEEFLREAKEKFEEQWKNQSQVSEIIKKYLILKRSSTVTDFKQVHFLIRCHIQFNA